MPVDSLGLRGSCQQPRLHRKVPRWAAKKSVFTMFWSEWVDFGSSFFVGKNRKHIHTTLQQNPTNKTQKLKTLFFWGGERFFLDQKVLQRFGGKAKAQKRSEAWQGEPS